jgi:orotidine-5'-phosphate decarboxylase
VYPVGMLHFVDRLLQRIEQASAPICIGFDPVYSRLPLELRRRGDDELHAILTFAERTFPVFAEHAPVIKLQSACFERYGFAGVGLYEVLIHKARQLGLLVIGDVKRGDIGSTAEHYAAATLTDPPSTPAQEWPSAAADAVTVNMFSGPDGLEPFLRTAAEHGKGLFAWVRGSNPGSDAVQSLELADGRTVAQALAQMVSQAGRPSRYVGESGYSLLGAVVAATKPQDMAGLRELMPQQIFLVPGFGAQGGSAAELAPVFKSDGSGALITASRSITYAYGEPGASNWLSAIAAAVVQFKAEVAGVLR